LLGLCRNGICADHPMPLLHQVRGPITIVAGKRRRLTFVECPQVSFVFCPPGSKLEHFDTTLQQAAKVST
jgi:hypothetical protein